MQAAGCKRSWWRELRRSCRGCHPTLALKLCLFEEGFSLNFLGFYIPLFFLDRWRWEPEEIMESWGLALHERTAIYCTWGPRTKFISLPWEYDFVKGSHQVRRPDGSWVEFVGSWELGPKHVVNDRGATFGGKEPDGRLEETHPFRYVLKSGEVQERLATIYVERREWRQRWLKWTPWFAKKRTSIDVSFNAEVGERTGSWKGGVMGTGYDLRPGETPLDSLRRMEREWKA